MAVAKKGFEFFLNRLLKGFRSVEKREPNNLEMILIRQEAGNKAKDAAKVIEVDFGKPFNKEIEAMIKSGDVKVGKADKTPPYQKSQADIEFEIMEKIKSDNEKAVRAFESRNPNPKKAGKGRFTKAEYLIQRLRNTIKDNPDDKYVQETFPGFIKELEANPDLAKNKNVFRELGEDLPDNQKITVFDDDTLDFATLQPTKKFRLNKERFKKDFNVTDEEVEKISILSPEDQQKKVREYIDKDFKERIELSDYDVTDLEPNAEGGRAGYYTGGMIDVEPNLSDIGHGSDSLMARTRLVSPNSQATTSTGLNYLLAEDNDNIRVPFGNGKSVYDRNSFQHKINELKAAFKHYKRGSATGGRQGTMTFEQFAPLFAKENFAEGGRTGFQGGGMGRRAFLKLLATLGGATAAVKSGILGLGGKEATKKAVTETVKQSAGSGTPPPYFFKLVEKIKTLGDDVTEKAATTERQKVTKYKDYELTEDVATGEQTIQKIKTDGPEYYDEQLAEEVYMNYKPGKGLADEGTKGIPADEYIEDTGYLRTSGPDKGELFDSADGLTDDSFKEIMEEIGEVVTKKASGGIAQMIGE